MGETPKKQTQIKRRNFRMKRKLALLLAIVMILSLVPMSAFAASSRYASTVDADKTSVVADNTATAKFTVYLLNADGTAAVNETVYFASQRGSEETFTVGGVAVTDVTADGTYYAEVTDTTGKIEVKVKSSTPGDTKIAFANKAADLVGYLNGKDISALDAGLIATKNLTFTAASAGFVEILSVDGSNVKANGLDYFTVTAKVWTASKTVAGVEVADGRPVAGETVKISANKSATTFNATEKTTNAAGIATFKVYSSKPEAVKVEVSAAGKVASSTLTFEAGGLYNIEAVSSNNQVIAKDSVNKTFKFKVNDVSGNMVKAISAADLATIDMEIVDEPDDSSLSTPTISQEASGNVVVKITDKLAYEGAYKLRVSLPNGKYQEINFTVKKQGAVNKITIAYDEAALALSTDLSTVAGTTVSGTPTIDTFDANNVKKSVKATDAKITVVSSNPGLISVEADGSLKVMTTKTENIGKEVTITVVDEENKLTATTTMKIAGSVAGFNAKAPAEVTLVDKNAKVDIEFVDEKGNVVALGAGKAASLDSFVILAKPEGAAVSVEEGTDFGADSEDVGTTYLDVTSSKAGDVKLQLLISSDSKKYTQNVTVKFGTPAVVAPVVGAKSLVLNIGSTFGIADGAVKTMDVAPFIKDGRTFVPVRFIAEQLGAEVSFTQTAAGLTETVTLTKGDLVVTMTMGSKDIKVVKAGVTTTVAADVAAYVEAGRTVLPFRALAEAMGAEVAYGMTADNAAVAWVSFNQK